MSKDPAFLFYDGDAARDVSHMNRLERGCYFDLIQAQKKFGGYTVEQARKILGKDFTECWPALELILKEENGMFYIEWVKDSMNTRAQFTENQRKRIQTYWDNKKIPRNDHGNTTVLPEENAIENAIVIENKEVVEVGIKEGGVGETKISAYRNFINRFNEIRQSRFTDKDKKAQTGFFARINDGYTVDDMLYALQNFMQDEFHQKNQYKHLTPEFITRPDKIEKGGNINNHPAIPEKESTFSRNQRLAAEHYRERFGEPQPQTQDQDVSYTTGG